MWFFKKTKKKEQPAVVWLEEVESTNDEMRRLPTENGQRISVVVADFQCKGRGQGTNTWESERGKNLLFSIKIRPVMVPVRCQFLLSMAGGLAIKDALDAYTAGITLKWPNDVYWNDRKICGTLIETTLSAGRIKDCIFGIGLNVNQQVFTSDAPNPVSLAQILDHETDRKKLLNEVLEAFDKYYSWIENGRYGDISALYHEALYHRHGFYLYSAQRTARVGGEIWAACARRKDANVARFHGFNGLPFAVELANRLHTNGREHFCFDANCT